VGEHLAPIARLVRALQRLPGVGEKTATRLAYFLVSSGDVAIELGQSLLRLQKEVLVCSECFNLAEESPCPVCADPERDPGRICVVEEPADVASIEKSGAYQGRYHVLGGALAPLDGIGPDSLRIAPLVERVRAGGVREVILATNPNPEGEAAALYVADQLGPLEVPVTRIGYGMPMGGDLEYVDAVTLRKSLENRRTFGT
jgi:recombination protein RecR